MFVYFIKDKADSLVNNENRFYFWLKVLSD